MSKFEDPLQFDVKKNFGKFEIEYFDLEEISQGGPEVGTLAINGQKIKGRYGGPALYKGEFLYAPSLVKKFFGFGFRLAKISINTRTIEYLTKTKDLIYIFEVDDNKIYFFEDMNRTKQSHRKI